MAILNLRNHVQPGRAARVIFNFDFEHGVRRMRHERGVAWDLHMRACVIPK